MPVPGLSRRPAEDGDREFLFEVFGSTREEELARAPWTDAMREQFLRQQFHAQDTHYRTYYPGAVFDVVLLDGAPAGRLYVHRWRGDIRIIDIALLPAFRRRGIGEYLIRELFAEADRDGLTVSIHVEVNNPARRLYDRLGFVVVEDKGVYLLMERPPIAAADRP
jgi:ribosomal protein S18 acetylase RimI-like enzyme